MSILAAVLGSLFIAIVWNILFWDRSFGVSVPVFSIIVMAFLFWIKKGNLFKSRITLSVHLLLILYLSLSAACWRNGLIIYAAIPTIFFGLFAIVFAEQEGYSISNSIGLVESLFK